MTTLAPVLSVLSAVNIPGAVLKEPLKIIQILIYVGGCTSTWILTVAMLLPFSTAPLVSF